MATGGKLPDSLCLLDISAYLRPGIHTPTAVPAKRILGQNMHLKKKKPLHSDFLM